MSWLVWHSPELVAVMVPLLVAVTVSTWGWLVFGVVAVVWVARAIRDSGRQAAIRAGRDMPSRVENGAEFVMPALDRDGS